MSIEIDQWCDNNERYWLELKQLEDEIAEFDELIRKQITTLNMFLVQQGELKEQLRELQQEISKIGN